MEIVLFDLPEDRIALKPFSFTRPLSKLRVGIATIEEKWKHYLPGTYAYMTCAALHVKYTHVVSDDAWHINATICPDSVLAETVERLKVNEVLLSEEGTLIAFRGDGHSLKQGKLLEGLDNKELNHIVFSGEITQVKHRWDIFLLNAKEIEKDWAWHTKDKISKPILDPHTAIYHEKNIFIEDGLAIKSALLNAEKGPIYIGKNVSIAEGAVLRGPLAICDNVVIQAHAYMHGGSTIGPFCHIGGEVYNSIMFGYSDKPHQGFIGHTVVGEWCAIAAGTNLSQSNKGFITVWNFDTETICPEKHLTVCGFFMGDYGQIGGNATLEPGSVMSIAANLRAGKLCAKYVPAFTYRDADGTMETVPLETMLEWVHNRMQSKNQVFSKEDQDILCDLFKITDIQRIKARMMDHAICRNT